MLTINAYKANPPTLKALTHQPTYDHSAKPPHPEGTRRGNFSESQITLVGGEACVEDVVYKVALVNLSYIYIVIWLTL